jgi:zinc and cadmium transporter
VELALVVGLGVAMTSIAMVGSVTLLLSEAQFARLLSPLVALAAGSLLGGAFWLMLPEAVRQLGNTPATWVGFVGGFVAFFLLEQLLHWHHCHRAPSHHRPVGQLILVADALHNFIGGLTVTAVVLVDVRLGLATWAAAALHEVPQELGDFGILVNSGWGRRRALLWNLASGATFLVGGLLAWAVSGALDVAYLIPIAAGNFAYIGATDLLPELTTDPSLASKATTALAFAAGLGAIAVAAALGA